MALQHTGHTQPSIDLEEHRSLGGINAKAVVPYAFSGSTLIPQGSALVGEAYDYIVASPNMTQPTTLTYKLGGSGGTTVATLTFAYSGTDVTSITRS